MANGKVLLTQEGYDKLQEELDYLVTVKRAENSEKIKIARGFGDLSENDEYHQAKNEQAADESRILEIEQYLKNVEIIKETSNKRSKTVTIGDTVKVVDQKSKREMELKIVGTIEADIAQSKISNESPVGKALLNAKEGDVVQVKIKDSTISYKVEKIIR